MMLPSIIVAAVLVSTALGDACPSGWRFVQGECVKKINTPLSFGDARRMCQSLKADLIMIKSLQQTGYVARSLGVKSGWIGIFDDDKDGQFSYVDGEPLGSYQPWGKGEPNNWRGNERCVASTGNIPYKRGKWNDVNCDTKYPFFCASRPCPSGYKHYEAENLCMRKFNTPMSFNNARKACMAQNGDLMKIKNSDQYIFIQRHFSKGPMWIGVWDHNKDGVFSYVDGSSLKTFHPWNRGEPNNWRGNERCVAMKVRWNDVNCGVALPFICSLDNCPAGWTHMESDDTCVRGVSTPMSFNDARSACQAMKGDLVKITDRTKNGYVARLMGRDSAWIGAWDDNKDGTFTYLDGTELGSFDSWNRGEPNNWNGNERCAAMKGAEGTRRGYWNDVNCAMKLKFVCSMAALN